MARIGGDMNELCKNLGGDRNPIGRGQQARDHVPGGDMLGVLYQLGGDEKAGVEAMDHGRPSSISPSRSSSEVSGRTTAPTLTVGISRMLCDCWASVGWTPGANTVISCRSGRRTRSSSTTPPFRPRPRATIRGLVSFAIPHGDFR